MNLHGNFIPFSNWIQHGNKWIVVHGISWVQCSCKVSHFPTSSFPWSVVVIIVIVGLYHRENVTKSSFCSAKKLMYSSTTLINIFGCTYNFLLNQCEGQQWARCRESQISSIFCCSGEFGFFYNCCDRSYCCAITAPCHQLCLHWWCNRGQRGLRPLSILGRHSYPQWGPTSIVW